MAIVLDGTNGVTTNSGTLISATTIGVGGATPSTSGAGITFPATQSASSNANTLDDYEEGTFTPTFVPSSGSLTSYTSAGRYVKTGQSVTVWFHCIINSVGTASGALDFSNLPFTSANGTGGNNNQTPVLARETNATGLIYGGYMSANATTGAVTTLTNGAITWGNDYRYSIAYTYQASA